MASVQEPNTLSKTAVSLQWPTTLDTQANYTSTELQIMHSTIQEMHKSVLAIEQVALPLPESGRTVPKHQTLPQQVSS
jgi:hypothetical protein